MGIAYAAVDLAAAEAAFFAAVLLRYHTLYPIPPFFNSYSYLFYALLLILLYVPVLYAVGVNRERVPSVQGLFKSVFLLSVLVTILAFYFRDFAFSRIAFLSFCALTFIFGLLWRFVFQLALGKPSLAWLVRERVLLAARAERLPALAAALEKSSAGRFEIKALAAEGKKSPDTARILTESGLGGLEEGIGAFDEVPKLAVQAGVDVVFIDPEGMEPERWLSLARNLAAKGIGLRLLFGLEPDLPLGLSPGTLETGEALEYLVGPIGGFQALAKRFIDIAVSVVVLIAALPLMLVIALLIKLSSPGPVIYSQERVGRDGVVFNLHKFRSMVHEAERTTGPVWSSTDDKRVIPGIGSFIRRTGLDELPQFWNVLRGKMSLVGPRPERAYFFDSYPELYRGRLAVRPGLTGLAQVNCRNTTSVELKVRHDLYYIHNYSLGLDLEILWRTSVMLVFQEWRAIFCGKKETEPETPASALEKKDRQGPREGK